MKTYIPKILIFIFFCTNNFTQNKINITFLVKTKALIDTSKVYITGNNSLLGNWNPSKVSLTAINDSTWERTFSFEPETSLEYKFTLGSWGTEALNSDGAVSSNMMLEVLGDTTVQISISNWKENEENKISGQITGAVKYHRDFIGEGIEPRDIIVWLPPDYEKDTTKRYPVLYMHDGENIFDPATSSFGVDWQLDETADRLIKAEKIKGIIIVGIYNTIDRSAEYGDTDKGRMYMKFIVHELKPFIDKNYRTKPDRGNTATGGSSLGGLISFMLAWEYPNIFSKAACISPAFYIKDIDYLKTVKNYNGSKKQIKIYIDDGGIGLEKRLQPGIDSLIVLLNQKQYVDGKDYIFYKDINAEHSEYFWAKRAWRFLEFFFPK